MTEKRAHACAKRSAPLLLEGATLLDGVASEVRTDAALLVIDGRIAEVGSRGQLPRPEGVQTEELSGGFLMAGLIDAHAHAEQDWVLCALMTMGVTHVRNPARTLPARLPAASPEARPDVLWAGFAIDAPGSQALGAVEAHNEQQLRAQVREQIADGADFIKLYTGLSAEMVRAAVAEAHAGGVKVIGDLEKTSWTEAAEAGIDFLAHAAPRHAALLPVGKREGFARDCAQRRCHPIWRWFELVDLDGPEIGEMIETLVDREVVVEPTLTTLEAMCFGRDPSYHAAVDPASVLLPADSPLRRAMSAGKQDAVAVSEQARSCWRKVLGLVRRLHERGVRLIAGTDTPRPWVIPGASLHRELSLLSAAGLSSLDALLAATQRSANALGIGQRAGTVQVGRAADLVLLGADPLADIANTTRIRWVMRHGVRHDPVQLRAQYA